MRIVTASGQGLKSGTAAADQWPFGEGDGQQIMAKACNCPSPTRSLERLWVKQCITVDSVVCGTALSLSACFHVTARLEECMSNRANGAPIQLLLLVADSVASVQGNYSSYYSSQPRGEMWVIACQVRLACLAPYFWFSKNSDPTDDPCAPKYIYVHA